MIDFDRFWTDPGTLPGMTEEQTQPGVSDEQIAAWERDRGVRLPDVLREALRRQNGGFVGDEETGCRILPLDRIVPMEDDAWEWAFCDEDEDDAPDRRLILEFGYGCDGTGGTLYLNYADCGPQGEPSVVLYYSDGGEFDPCAESLAEFFEQMLATNDAPEIDWSETERLSVVARETIDLSAMYRAAASLDQVLGWSDGALHLYTRETTPEGERLSRTRLPLPLDAGWASVSPLRPGAPGTFALHLQPKDADGIVHVESRLTRDGRWKNSTDHGVPIYVQFESTDRRGLDELRNSLFGEAAVERVRRQDDVQERLQARFATLSPEQQQAAAMQMVLQMQAENERFMREQYPELDEPPPPELAEAARVMQEKLAQAMQQGRDIVARNPLDPETARLVDEMVRLADDESEDRT
jgi:hypothetical protein